MSRYFDLGRIAGGTLHEEPFKWGHFSRIWRGGEIEHAVATDFPTDGFNYRERNGGYFYRRTVVPLASNRVLGPETLSATWCEMCEELTSPTFRSAVAKFCRTDLTDFPMEAVAFRGGQDTHYLPHVDASLRCGFRLIIYFNHGWKEEWGGVFRILNPVDHRDIRHAVLPLIGSANMIIRDGQYNETWHEVTRLSARGAVTRNTLNVTFYEPGTTSTSQ
ncbi:2OG-Fe(II) oxygenase (plasmid) [Ralstonia syzygii subsp. celebesensis]|uniref:SanC n=3 Tax=Ralstonia solanacearum species complex TaxID=3116862 RepID=A0AAD0WJD5_RALSL|nr:MULTISPECIES: 2OG-Fe(II) oxygenase [Ralstonia solanacearum species complex]CCA82454.1 conserved hypothethical protein, putative sannC homologue [blood disease bacterium R229]AQW32762.1 SanC [blood disease bacterium A2-HR MARDI]AXV84801.1 SanC [Ralstonia solanacearum]AXW55933.1 SanC [Ralstonia solanacearum]QQV57180.1 2OG-Fe(II) oxygenase [Ralstonia syzygii subsp. celebesensis]